MYDHQKDELIWKDILNNAIPHLLINASDSNPVTHSRGTGMFADFEFTFYKNEFLEWDKSLIPNCDRIIHFTSIPKLYSILNEGFFRLYNLTSTHDPSEFNWIADEMKLHPEHLTSLYKENTYFGSFCDKIILTDSKTLMKLWKEYGDDYKGAILEFEVINKWKVNDYYFIKIKYGKPNISMFLQSIKDIGEKHGKSIDYRDLVKKISPFYKNIEFEDEKEIRICLFELLQENLYNYNESYNNIVLDYSNSGRSRYYKFPIYYFKNSFGIILKKITLGSKIDNKYDIVNDLEYILRLQFAKSNNANIQNIEIIHD